MRHRGTLGGALAHADPAGDLGARRRSRSRRSWSSPGRRGAGGGARRSSSRTTSPPPSAMARSSPRSASRSTPVGQPLREVQPRRAGLVDRRGRRDGEGGRRHDHRRPHRADQHGRTPVRARGVETALVGQCDVRGDDPRAAAEHAAEGTAAPRTRTPARTTASTSPRCSPVGRCSPRRADASFRTWTPAPASPGQASVAFRRFMELCSWRTRSPSPLDIENV